jgi:prevent-host-death family protein
MKTVSVSELKAHLSAELRRVKAGEDILVVERGRAIARLVPVARDVLDAELDRLVETGLVRPGSGALGSAFWRASRPRDPEGHLRGDIVREREVGW